MAYKSYQGWYKLVNPEKFVKPLDEHMKSFKDNAVNYKSKLELIAFKYADFNKHIKSWSVEPFPIYYIKPTDKKRHRYYIDLVLEFTSGDKFLIEVKSSSETKPPKQPKTKTKKSMARYHKALETYSVNQAKWTAARQFAKENNMRFSILTEKELKG